MKSGCYNSWPEPIAALGEPVTRIARPASQKRLHVVVLEVWACWQERRLRLGQNRRRWEWIHSGRTARKTSFVLALWSEGASDSRVALLMEQSRESRLHCQNARWLRSVRT